VVAHDGGTDERHLDIAACLDLRHGQRGIDIGFDAEGIGKRHDERKPQQESGEPEQAAKGWMFQFAASTIRIPRT